MIQILICSTKTKKISTKKLVEQTLDKSGGKLLRKKNDNIIAMSDQSTDDDYYYEPPNKAITKPKIKKKYREASW